MVNKARATPPPLLTPRKMKMEKTINDEIDLQMIKELVVMSNEEYPRLIERIPVRSTHVFLGKRITIDDPELNQVARKIVFNAARKVPAPLLPAALGFTGNTTELSALERFVTELAASQKARSAEGGSAPLFRHINAEIEHNLDRALGERVPAREILSGKPSTGHGDELDDITNSFVCILTLNCPKGLLPHALGVAQSAPLDYSLFARFVQSYASHLPALGADPFLAMLVKESRATLETALELRL